MEPPSLLHAYIITECPFGRLPDQIPKGAKPEFETKLDYEDPVGQNSNNGQKDIRSNLE